MDDIAEWEADLGFNCDNQGCENQAGFVMELHANHGHALRCKRCMDLLHLHNTDVMMRYGYIRCGMCNDRFTDLKHFMKIGKL